MVTPQKTRVLCWERSRTASVVADVLQCLDVCTGGDCAVHHVSKRTCTASICMCQPVLPMQSRGGGGTGGMQLHARADFPPLLMGPCQWGCASGAVTLTHKRLLEKGPWGNEGSTERGRNGDNPSASGWEMQAGQAGRVLSSRVCDAAQRAHAVPTGVGTKTSGVSTDLLIPPKQGNSLSPSAVGPSHRENGREGHISFWGSGGAGSRDGGGWVGVLQHPPTTTLSVG